MRLLSSLKSGLAIAATSAAFVAEPKPTAAYPIDCAILLCLAGGFPPSAECAAAQAKMIQRITPWPITPPLQLWNCPMEISPDVAAATGLSNSNVGADGLTPEVRAYRDDIEIYHIKYSRAPSWNDRGNNPDIVNDLTTKGDYEESGDYVWRRSAYEHGPAWLANAVGGTRYPVRICVRTVGANDRCAQWRTLRTENRANPDGYGSIRGVAIRTRDYKGDHFTEFVPY